ncbi:hypothetical protein P4S95_27795 [Aneurinibacillus aneurinilyticus]|uniref:Uncharacterized protein n=1 Tax=Aneurinibacillus aneurinilyticus TaxID=1391 RepID=A0A848CZI9_ANEAE|nr:hypothetical protein [Aneurinibacillus aneurinilyticus]MED0673942.1 hypothetical protein [Aneurinibacillus aneurinilyticus]NME98952.1 hypothetical protein [Aneurinibacillus aneurinilyticus]
MENNFILNLEMPGMVIFDLLTLTDYLREKRILTNDLLAYFVSNEEIGEEVITSGYVFNFLGMENLQKLMNGMQKVILFVKNSNIYQMKS